MKKTLLTALQYVVFLGIGIVIMFYMWGKLTEEQKDSMFDAIARVRYWLLVPIFIAGFFSHFFRALRWKLLMEPLGLKPSTANVTFSVLLGYLANLLAFRTGEVVKCTVLARYEKIPADKMVGTIVSERAFDVICLVIVTVSSFLLQSDVIGEYAQDILYKVSAKTDVFIFALIALVLLIVALVLIYRNTKESKIGRFIKGMGEGVRSILQMKKRGSFILYTVLIWLMYWAQVQIGFWSMEATDGLGGLAALVVLVFGSLGMITTQGGIGAYTFLVADILLFYGIAEAPGQAFGWVSWSVQAGIVIVLGFGSLILLPIYNRRKNAKAAVDSK